MTEPDYYPAWLAPGLIDYAFPWQSAQTISMPHFLARYLLHDSPWIGFWFGAEPIALIRWDTFWCQGRLPFPGSDVAEWPILLIKFARVYQYWVVARPEMEEFIVGEVIAVAESSPIEAHEREALLAASLQSEQFSDEVRKQFLDETLHHTIFTGAYRQHVHLFHGGDVQVLCIDHAGNAIPIPGLAE